MNLLWSHYTTSSDIITVGFDVKSLVAYAAASGRMLLEKQEQIEQVVVCL